MDYDRPTSHRRTKTLTALPNVPSHLRADSIASTNSTTATITTSDDSADSTSPPPSPSTSGSSKPHKQVRFDPEPTCLSFFDWGDDVEFPEVQPESRGARWRSSRTNFRRSWSARQASPPPPRLEMREEPVNVPAVAENDEFAAWLKRSSRVGKKAFADGAEMEAVAHGARSGNKGEVKKKRRSIANFFGLS